MIEKQIYLYRLLEEYRSYKNDDSPLELCNYFHVKVLFEEDRKLFFGKEKAYFIVEADGKSCIVIEKILPEEIQHEIFVYSVFKILLLRKFTDERKDIQCFYKGTMIEYFFEEENYVLGKANKDELCIKLLLETVIPTAKLPLSLKNSLNSHKIKTLSQIFEIREEFVLQKCKLIFPKLTLSSLSHYTLKR